MLCDDTVACVVCLETKKMIMKHRITSLQEPEYSFVNFYTLYNSSSHSLSKFSIHLQLICSLINVISGNK